LEPELGAGSTETSGVRVPPPLYYVAGFLAGVALELAFPIERPPLAITLLGTAIGAVGWLALDGAAMLFFSRARTTMMPTRPSSALVTTGPYRFTRNPIYIGMFLGLIGLAVAFDSLWVIVLLVPFYLVIRYGVVAREEAYLERKFGDVYLAYKARVSRWL
jgi:protein-S-isoprenylcysteine O-methyltransferase Ste14